MPDRPPQSGYIQEVVNARQDDILDVSDETRSSEETFTPLLSWDKLAQYPQGIQRVIVIEWVENQKHRRTLEARRLRNAFIERALGMTLGSALALAFIVGTVHAILSGYGTEGLIGIGTTVTAIAIVYVRRGKRIS